MITKTRTTKNRLRQIARSKQSSSLRLMPTIDSLEERVVLSSTGFLQGTAFIDSNGNSKLDVNDTLLAGATIKLYDSSNNLLNSQITGNDGSYLFTGLAPGNYKLVELAPSGYKNSGTDFNSPLNPASIDGVSPLSTIDVHVNDLSLLTVDYDRDAAIATYQPGAVTLNAFDVKHSSTISQKPITVTVSGTEVGPFSTYCVNLLQSLTTA